ncbi:MAG TPA: FAD-binding oxidoreductase [Candidatus Nanoarchaeia archaeon]|nr:FAD-binding oxidoreductase [Candidatus Nanoarchaeia archaeon]
MVDVKSYDLKVSEIITLSPTAKALRFNLEGKPFVFKPGQFAMLEVSMQEFPDFKISDGVSHVQKRPLSVSSSSNNQKFLEFTIKMTGENPFFSKYIVDHVKVGDVMNIKGPYGVFVLDLKLANNTTLIGAGSGIAPLICMYRYVAESYPNKRVHLLSSNKTEDEILWKDEIVSLGKPKIRTHEFTLTQDNSENPLYSHGRISKEMIERSIPDIENTAVYLCGPPGMIQSAESALLEMGIPKEKIKKEFYN